MKKLAFMLLAAALLLLLTACESGGKFRVVNQTTHPLYLTLGDAAQVSIPGGTEQTFDIPTETQSFFNPDVEEEVPIRMVGETYQIYDEDEEAFTDSTSVYIKVGETLSAYINPNRAGFKVINNCTQPVTSVVLYKHNFVGVVKQYDLGSLAEGESKFICVDYATASNNFYYYAAIEMEDGSLLYYGDNTNILLVDQQFLINLTDPDK